VRASFPEMRAPARHERQRRQSQGPPYAHGPILPHGQPSRRAGTDHCFHVARLLETFGHSDRVQNRARVTLTGPPAGQRSAISESGGERAEHLPSGAEQPIESVVRQLNPVLADLDHRVV
jgi:hypothetical protein